MDSAGSWLRRLTGLLVALNLGLFMVGMLVQNWPKQGLSVRNMNADEIRLAATLPQIVPVAAEASSMNAEPTTTDSAVQALPVAESRCLIWQHLDSERVLALDKTLVDAGLKAGDYSWVLEEKLPWWTYLPPFADGAKLRAVLEELRQVGVTDADPVRAGSMINAVSLGVFPSLDKARQHANLMTKKGAKGVVFGLRPSVTPIRLMLAKTPDTDLNERLRQATRGVMAETCPPSVGPASGGSAQVSE